MRDETVCSLADIPGGVTCRMAVVQEEEGGISLALRSAAFGLIPGVPVRVIRNSGWGPMVVHARDTYLALGRKLARRLRVVQEAMLSPSDFLEFPGSEAE